ncbi:hypothetical protein GWI33_018230 [Rhynchophorus ferrugineus]|uniref:Uncharacterized protein n=1 Tax=Rhynchophorus ferrugineus TaxID=354439 RepID=A0A834M1Q4_RHYFE|nr:hypothetical protein GWI33_018230 [Rhynchophorus ferrugineus]
MSGHYAVLQLSSNYHLAPSETNFVLTNWKAAHKQQTSVDEEDFLHSRQNGKKSDNVINNDLINSFQATGIVRIDPYSTNKKKYKKLKANDGAWQNCYSKQ